MTKFLLLVSLVFIATIPMSGIAHASTYCYGFGESTSERLATSSVRYSQTFVAPASRLVSASFNIYGDVTDAGSFFHQIVETTAGVPNTTVFSGSAVTKLVATVPDAPIASTEQAFICGAIPATQTFVYPTPLTLVPGDLYALSIHETGGTGGRVAIVTGFPSIAAYEGYTTENVSPNWQLTEYPGGSAINFDIVYSIEDETIDAPVQADKIDGHISNLRLYLKLESESGGMIFGLIIVSVIFALALVSKIPFVVVAVFNLLLVGMFSRASIMPPWILLAVVAIAGIAVVFKVVEGRSQGGSGSHES